MLPRAAKVSPDIKPDRLHRKRLEAGPKRSQQLPRRIRRNLVLNNNMRLKPLPILRNQIARKRSRQALMQRQQLPGLKRISHSPAQRTQPYHRHREALNAARSLHLRKRLRAVRQLMKQRQVRRDLVQMLRIMQLPHPVEANLRGRVQA